MRKIVEVFDAQGRALSESLLASLLGEPESEVLRKLKALQAQRIVRRSDRYGGRWVLVEWLDE